MNKSKYFKLILFICSLFFTLAGNNVYADIKVFNANWCTVAEQQQIPFFRHSANGVANETAEKKFICPLLVDGPIISASLRYLNNHGNAGGYCRIVATEVSGASQASNWAVIPDAEILNSKGILDITNIPVGSNEATYQMECYATSLISFITVED